MRALYNSGSKNVDNLKRQNKNKKMNDISSDESTDEEEINKNFETEAQLTL